MTALEAAVGDWAVTGPRTFVDNAGSVTELPADARSGVEPPGPEATRQLLVGSLTRALYDRLYLNRPPTLIEESLTRVATARRDEPFERRLIDACAPSRSIDEGWTVLEARADGLLLEQQSVRVRADRSEIVDGTCVAPGSVVAIWMPAVRRLASPGFLAMVGSAGSPRGAGVVRLYVNVTAESASDLVAGLTEPLEDGGVPYTLKVLNAPVAFDRPDAAVVYLGARDVHLTVEIARGLPVERLERIPAFTLAVDGGIALAQDPGPQPGGAPISFGEHRCRLVADGLVDAHDAGMNDASRRIEMVCARFDAAGVSPASPWQHDLDLAALRR